MKKTVATLLGLCFTVLTYAQANTPEKLIALGKAYKDFMFNSEPAKDVLKDLKKNMPAPLKAVTDFTIQTITTNNKLLTTQFLSRPDDQVLKQVFIVSAIFDNITKEDQVDNKRLIDSLTLKDIPVYELVDNYYGMLFTAVGNKNQPFDFSKVDFKLNEYGLKDDTEKGILFLRCMRGCNSLIWGFMNIVKPPNTRKAYELIKKYPRFNGRPYYQYTDFYFADFDMIISRDEGIQSYKGYYLDKYFETLLFHLVCLNKENGSGEDRNALLLGSILRERKLYKYTARYKETLEEIFKEQKQ